MHLIVSYVPLLRGEAGKIENLMDGEGDLTGRALEACPDGSCSACIWDRTGSRPEVFLVIEKAREVAEHLAEWAEGDAAGWFDLEATDAGTHYAVALVPRIRKSVDRHKAALALKAGLPEVPALDSYNIIFRPLHFRSAFSSSMFTSVKGELGETCRVSLLDPSDLDLASPSESTSKAFPLGDFRVAWDGSYVKSIAAAEDGK